VSFALSEDQGESSTNFDEKGADSETLFNQAAKEPQGLFGKYSSFKRSSSMKKPRQQRLSLSADLASLDELQSTSLFNADVAIDEDDEDDDDGSGSTSVKMLKHSSTESGRSSTMASTEASSRGSTAVSRQSSSKVSKPLTRQSKSGSPRGPARSSMKYGKGSQRTSNFKKERSSVMVVSPRDSQRDSQRDSGIRDSVETGEFPDARDSYVAENSDDNSSHESNDEAENQAIQNLVLESAVLRLQRGFRASRLSVAGGASSKTGAHIARFTLWMQEGAKNKSSANLEEGPGRDDRKSQIETPESNAALSKQPSMILEEDEEEVTDSRAADSKKAESKVNEKQSSGPKEDHGRTDSKNSLPSSPSQGTPSRSRSLSKLSPAQELTKILNEYRPEHAKQREKYVERNSVRVKENEMSALRFELQSRSSLQSAAELQIGEEAREKHSQGRKSKRASLEEGKISTRDTDDGAENMPPDDAETEGRHRRAKLKNMFKGLGDEHQQKGIV